MNGKKDNAKAQRREDARKEELFLYPWRLCAFALKNPWNQSER